MNREQLAARHAEVLHRHGRALADAVIRGGVPSALLLAELAAVADEHAADQPRRGRVQTAANPVNDRA